MFCSPGDDNNNNNPADDEGFSGGVQRTLLISDCDIVKEEVKRLEYYYFRKGKHCETHPVITIHPAAYPAMSIDKSYRDRSIRFVGGLHSWRVA